MRPTVLGKNLTPRRMLKTSFLIAQIFGWNNSFQNMFDIFEIGSLQFGTSLSFPEKRSTLP